VYPSLQSVRKRFSMKQGVAGVVSAKRWCPGQGADLAKLLS
jgi:hypothetical protein